VGNHQRSGRIASAIPWGRILAESFAIIASILIAFGIDAAWDSYREREELRELVEGIHSELIANRALATEAEASTNEALARLRFFSSAPEDSVAATSPQHTFGEIYLPLIRDWNAAFSLSFLEATIGGGKLALVQQPDTRAALTEFRAAVESLDGVERELDRMGAEAAAIVGSYSGGRAMWNREDSGLDAATVRALHRDPRLAGLASARLIYFGGYLTSLTGRVRPSIDRAIELLERDLAALR